MGIGGVIVPLQNSVIAKIRNLAPNGANRWTDSFIRSMVHFADMMLCEQAEINWARSDISLTASATYFAVPVSAIWVGAVLYSEDGTTYNDGVLWPVTINELDQTNPTWKDTIGTKPTHYFLLSTPGTSGSRIGIYPKMSAATSQKIRIVCLACRPDNNLLMFATSVPENIEDIYYVPMVMAMLYGGFDTNTANHYLDRAMNGINIIRGMYANRRDDVFSNDSPMSAMGGQLA